MNQWVSQDDVLNDPCIPTVIYNNNNSNTTLNTNSHIALRPRCYSECLTGIKQLNLVHKNHLFGFMVANIYIRLERKWEMMVLSITAFKKNKQQNLMA